MKQWKQIGGVMTKKEKNLVTSALVVILIAAAFLLTSYIIANRVIIPSVGGEYTEGLVGEPQYINPLYTSINDVDTDLSRLIYSGLLKWDEEKGYIGDLADKIEIDEEKTTYTITLKENAKFHDGESVRARDVLFTLSAIQNPAYRSPLAANFQSATISQVDDLTVEFTLKKPLAKFEQFLTLGILPAHVWSDILPQNAPLAALNLQPIGSGPYQFSSFAKDKKGFIRSYTLKRNESYFGEEPKIELLNFKFYPDAGSAMQALTNKNVEGVSVVPFEEIESAKNNRSIKLVQPFIPQKMVLIFNRKSGTELSKHTLRTAVSRGIDKKDLVENVLHEKARVIKGPILENKVGYHDSLETPSFDKKKAESILKDAGYRTEILEVIAKETTDESEETETKEDSLKQLTLSLTTIASPEHTAVATRIQQQLKEVGINIEIKTVSSERLFVDVIDPQNYELLLTSVLSGPDSDPYVFWHSSQTKQGGLNIAKYKSASADKQLEKARSATDNKEKEKALKRFQEILAKDLPAIFLYQSTYSFAVSKKVEGVDVKEIGIPSDRFNKITNWFIKTKKALR